MRELERYLFAVVVSADGEYSEKESSRVTSDELWDCRMAHGPHLVFWAGKKQALYPL